MFYLEWSFSRFYLLSATDTLCGLLVKIYCLFVTICLFFLLFIYRDWVSFLFFFFIIWFMWLFKTLLLFDLQNVDGLSSILIFLNFGLGLNSGNYRLFMLNEFLSQWSALCYIYSFLLVSKLYILFLFIWQRLFPEFRKNLTLSKDLWACTPKTGYRVSFKGYIYPS